MNSREQAARIVKEIERLAALLDREINLMEVCGTHTVCLRRTGIHSLLPGNIRLLSGPGCPVCVTPASYIDRALSLIENENALITTFGDMLKVPAAKGRLVDYSSEGHVQVIYSPAELPEIAANSARETVFLAIGFETTIPVILSALREAELENVNNLSLLTAFKTVPPALEALLADKECRVDGFILPGHVSVIIGEEGYRFLDGRLPSVITGFEPLEMLLSIYRLLLQLSEGRAEVENCYPQVVSREGNRVALKLMEELLQPEDALWRGMGKLEGSGLQLKEEYSHLDAARRFNLAPLEESGKEGCLCGEVISGKLLPPACPNFGQSCTPLNPLGPCMVSSEGSCAAHYRYGG